MTNNPSRTQDHAARGTQHTTHKRRWEWLATGVLVLAVVLGFGGFLALRIQQGTLNDRLRPLLTYEGASEAPFRLLQQGASVNVRGVSGLTPLLVAVRQGNPEMVEHLLKRRADVNARDNLGLTPLVAALGRSQPELVRRLLQAGADPNVPGSLQPPLHAAIYNGDLELIRLLLRHGADVNGVDNHGNNALMPLVGIERDWVYPRARLLIERGLNVNARASDGRTALMWAALRGDLKTVQLLLRHGADVNAADRNGWTALECTPPRYQEVRRALRAAGARQRSSRAPWKFSQGYPMAFSVVEEPRVETTWRRLFRYVTQPDR